MLHTTCQVKLFDKKKFAKIALDNNFETFVIYIAIIKLLITIPIYFSKAF